MDRPGEGVGRSARVSVCMLAVMMLGAACSGVPTATPTPDGTVIAPTTAPTIPPTPTLPPVATPGPDAVTAAQAVRSLFERHTAAWDAKDADAILALYAADVRFIDYLGDWPDESRRSLEMMVRASVQIQGLGGSASSYLVDTNGGVDSYDVWGLGDSTKANPVHEVDVFEVTDGLFSSLDTVYSLSSLSHITDTPVTQFAKTQDLIQGYADAWSSGVPTTIGALYAQTASRTDTLWGESAEGRRAIADAVARSFSVRAGAVWQVDVVFGDGARKGLSGGTFTVRFAQPRTCELGAAVVLETDQAQQIVTERVYWELDSLSRCGLIPSAVTSVPTS